MVINYLFTVYSPVYVRVPFLRNETIFSTILLRVHVLPGVMHEYRIHHPDYITVIVTNY